MVRLALKQGPSNHGAKLSKRATHALQPSNRLHMHSSLTSVTLGCELIQDIILDRFRRLGRVMIDCDLEAKRFADWLLEDDNDRPIDEACSHEYADDSRPPVSWDLPSRSIFGCKDKDHDIGASEDD